MRNPLNRFAICIGTVLLHSFVARGAFIAETDRVELPVTFAEVDVLGATGTLSVLDDPPDNVAPRVLAGKRGESSLAVYTLDSVNGTLSLENDMSLSNGLHDVVGGPGSGFIAGYQDGSVEAFQPDEMAQGGFSSASAVTPIADNPSGLSNLKPLLIEVQPGLFQIDLTQSFMKDDPQGTNVKQSVTRFTPILDTNTDEVTFMNIETVERLSDFPNGTVPDGPFQIDLVEAFIASLNRGVGDSTQPMAPNNAELFQVDLAQDLIDRLDAESITGMPESLAVSEDGTKLAVSSTVFSQDVLSAITIFDLDPQSGMLSNPIVLDDEGLIGRPFDAPELAFVDGLLLAATVDTDTTGGNVVLVIDPTGSIIEEVPLSSGFAITDFVLEVIEVEVPQEPAPPGLAGLTSGPQTKKFVLVGEVFNSAVTVLEVNSAAAAIPEPTTAVLLALAGAGGAMCRRRRAS